MNDNIFTFSVAAVRAILRRDHVLDPTTFDRWCARSVSPLTYGGMTGDRAVRMPGKVS